MPQFLNLLPADGGPAISLTVPTSWQEVTLGTFLQLFNLDDAGMLAVLLGLDTDTIGRIAADDVNYLANALAFAADHSLLLEQLPTPGLPEVGASPYGLLVLATQHVQALPEGSAGMLAAPYLYALYRCQQLYGKVDDAKVEAMRLAVLGEPVAKVYGAVFFILTDWLAFHERHATDEDGGDDYTDDELEAGLDEIDEQFGPFATLDALSGSDPTKYEQLLAIGAETMLTRIRLAQQQRRAQRRIFEMQQQPN